MEELRELVARPIPLPGGGNTAERHAVLMEVGRRDLSLARLAEAHWDAVAILAEAGRAAVAGAVYGVWASEIPGKLLMMEPRERGYVIRGTKRFCTGAGLLDRVLVTVGEPEHRLVEVDVRASAHLLAIDGSDWKTAAFAETQTATVTFADVPVNSEDIVGQAGWYLDRPGFWAGACGPASCWAGGAIGLLDFAMAQRRDDPHTLAHLGAMAADGWALRAYLETAGAEIDAHPEEAKAHCVTALTMRHLVEQAATDILRRIARAYGPAPMAMDVAVSRRYAELDLYLRQSHAERDLEALGRKMIARRTS
jgi:alkylation response protein AidB-like acyl-CoA dehydrogenase